MLTRIRLPAELPYYVHNLWLDCLFLLSRHMLSKIFCFKVQCRSMNFGPVVFYSDTSFGSISTHLLPCIQDFFKSLDNCSGRCSHGSLRTLSRLNIGIEGMTWGGPSCLHLEPWVIENVVDERSNVCSVHDGWYSSASGCVQAITPFRPSMLRLTHFVVFNGFWCLCFLRMDWMNEWMNELFSVITVSNHDITLKELTQPLSMNIFTWVRLRSTFF